MVQWVSGQSKQLSVGKIYNFGSLGLWAGWEYIGLSLGLSYIYLSWFEMQRSGIQQLKQNCRVPGIVDWWSKCCICLEKCVENISLE